MQSPPAEVIDMEQVANSMNALSTNTEVARKALNIFELVEMVVENLSPTGVVAVQRISHIWNNVSKGIIKRSPDTYLFLRTTPVPDASRQCLFDVNIGETSRSRKRKLMAGETEVPSNIVYRLHPLVRVRTVESSRGRWGRGLVITLDARRLAELGPGPWRDMFLSQPPITHDMVGDCLGPRGNLHASLRGSLGRVDAIPLTLGQMQDALLASLHGQTLPGWKYIFPVKIFIASLNRDCVCLKEHHRQCEAATLVSGQELTFDKFLQF